MTICIWELSKKLKKILNTEISGIYESYYKQLKSKYFCLHLFNKLITEIMKKILYSFIFLIGFAVNFLAQHPVVNYTITPATFEETETVTINFPNLPEGSWGQDIYLWAWSTDTNDSEQNAPTNGNWDASNNANKLTRNSAGNYSITFVPKTFYGRNTPLKTISFLVKTLNGSNQSADINVPVGKYQLTLTNPAENSLKYYDANATVNISATSSIAGKFKLSANGVLINETTSDNSSYAFTYTVSGDKNFELKGTAPDGATVTKTFTINQKPTLISEAIPSWIQQGINYDSADPTKVGLAIYAPGKDFVHVTGSFNGWTANATSLMKKDTSNPNLFWTVITGLTPKQIYTFQYKTSDNINIADPYSPLILSPDDDQYITSSTYPDLPAYPAGQKFDVSVVQTDMPSYPWKTTTFTKPAKENLIVYELLVRDFTQEKTWQSVIDKIGYIKGLGVNAIELMPIMEFDGNNSWGYNPSFHYALDKAYGTSNKFKEFVDLCHENGLAVILDIALNHATQRNPLVRLWNTNGGTGYASPSAENPFFNTSATHTYSVSEDFNHSKVETQYYVKRVIEHWMNEYKIDGFRWDLTKGFTQNCTSSDENCTNSYQQDRVDVLKKYSDYQWNLDPSSYVIFEHLGTDTEEKEWANYKIAEGKGIMMWDKLTWPYNQNTKGLTADSNFNRVNFKNHTGFTERRNLSYAESHDEERLMYENLKSGATSGSYSVKNLATALERMKAVGAVLLTVPGPKMIWQFGELGYDYSINRCQDGSINNNCRTDPKPIAFVENYDTNTDRKAIYDTWAKILSIRANNKVFNTSAMTVSSGNLSPRITITSKDKSNNEVLKQIVIIANFELIEKDIKPVPPVTPTNIWYDLMNNNEPKNFPTGEETIKLKPGEFRILGDAPGNNLSTDNVSTLSKTTELKIMQNPATNGEIKIQYNNAKEGTIYVYDLTGKFIQSYKIKDNKGEETLRINGLKAGLYLLQLKSNNGSVVAKVIVK